MHEKNYVSAPEKISRNPDWLCSYCECLNPDTSNNCIGCGALKEDSEKNYFKMKAEREAKQLKNQQELEKLQSFNDEDCSYKEHTYNNLDNYSNTIINNNIYSECNQFNSYSNKKDYNKKRQNINLDWNKIITIGASAFGILLLLFGLIWLFMPKKDTLTVKQINWDYSIEIQEEQTFKESGWDVPIGARVYDEKEELHHTDKVIDYYETVEVEKSKDVIVGYELEYVDLGNGYFEEVDGDPIYEKEYYIEEEQVPVYKDVPIFKTKYYYYIDKWVYKRSVDTNGIDKNPYFGEVNLKYKEREGTKTKNYSINVINKNEEQKTYPISEENWKKINVNDVLEVKVNKIGLITEILEIKRD